MNKRIKNLSLVALVLVIAFLLTPTKAEAAGRGVITNLSPFTIEVVRDGSNGAQLQPNESTPDEPPLNSNKPPDDEGVWSKCPYNTSLNCPYKLGVTDNTIISEDNQHLLPPGYLYISGKVNCLIEYGYTLSDYSCGPKDDTGYGPGDNYKYGGLWNATLYGIPDQSHAVYYYTLDGVEYWHVWWLYHTEPKYVLLMNNLEFCDAFGQDCGTHTDQPPQIDSCNDPDLFLDGVAIFDHEDCQGENRYWISSDFELLSEPSVAFSDRASSIYVKDGWSVLINDGDPNHMLCVHTSLWDLSQDYFPGTSVSLDNRTFALQVFTDQTCNGEDNDGDGDIDNPPGGGGSDPVKVYALANYAGSVVWSGNVGTSNIPNPNSYSIQIGSGLSVIVYDQDNQAGSFRCFNESVPNLQDHSWHLRIESIEVINGNACTDPEETTQATLYEHPNASGNTCSRDALGSQDICSGLNDTISSVYLSGGSVLLHKDGGQTGPALCLTEDEDNLAYRVFDDNSSADNAVSSFSLHEDDYCGDASYKDNAATLYEHSNYAGATCVIEGHQGWYNIDQECPGFNDKASGVNLIDNVSLWVFTEANNEGAYKCISMDNANLNDVSLSDANSADNRISSVYLLHNATCDTSTAADFPTLGFVAPNSWSPNLFYAEIGIPHSLPSMPNFNAYAPLQTGFVSNFSLGVKSRNDDFAIQFLGCVDVPASDDYTFYSSSDDGSLVYINNALVVNNDGLHGNIEKSGTINLVRGQYPIKVQFYESGGDEVLSVQVQGSNFAKQPIPDNWLSYAPECSGPDPEPIPDTATPTSTNTSTATNTPTPLPPTNTPVPTTSGLTLLSQNQPITASSQKSGHQAARANDGNPTSYWEANDGFPAWITVNLGSVKPVSKVVIGVAWPRTENIEILGSTDNVNFTTIVPATNYSLNTVAVTFTQVNVRYVKLVIASNSAAPAAQLHTFEVWGVPVATATPGSPTTTPTPLPITSTYTPTPTQTNTLAPPTPTKTSTATSTPRGSTPTKTPTNTPTPTPTNTPVIPTPPPTVTNTPTPGSLADSWPHSQVLTIDHTKVVANLVNFPVLIAGEVLSADLFTHATVNPLKTDANLRAYYSFDTSLTTDVSGHSYTLTNNGVVSAVGKYANAANFGDTVSNKKLRITNNVGIDLSNDYSIGLWFQLNKEITSGIYEILHLDDNVGKHKLSITYEYNGGNRRIHIQQNRWSIAGYAIDNTITLGTSNWYHVGLRKSGNTLSLFLNGIQVGSVTNNDLITDGTTAVTNGLYLGFSGSTNYSPILLDEVMLFSRALAPSEFASLTDFKSSINLRFSSDTEGFNQLPFEVVSISPENKKAEIWVKVPFLSSTTNTPVVVWYGNPEAEMLPPNDTYGSQHVWNDYALVMHLNETSGTRYDSTGHLNNATPTGSIANSTGKVGLGADFEIDNSQYLTIGANNSLDLSTFTIQAWAYNESFGSTYPTIVTNRSNADSNGNYFLFFHGDLGYKPHSQYWTGSDWASTTWGSNAIVNAWYMLFDIFDGTNHKISVNGATFVSNVQPPPVLNDNPVLIGKFNTSYFDGVIDELRMSTVVRTQAWITTEYNNQNAPQLFFIIP